MKTKLLILDGAEVPAEAIDILVKFSDVQVENLNLREDRTTVKNLVINKTILWVALGHMINSDLLENAKTLKHVVSTTTGHDHIDQEYLQKKGIILHSLKGDTEFLKTLNATAELAWCLLLSSARNILPALNDVKSGNWRRDLFKGNEISGKTLGIIGLGRLGTKVAEYGKAFDMKVIAFDENTDIKINGVECTQNVEEVFKLADFLSIHIHMNKKNERFVNQEKLSLMKKTASIINTSRGGLVDEDAVVKMLLENKIKSYAADVVENEQNNYKGPLRSLFESGSPKIILTPHIGGLTYETRKKAEIHMAEKLYNSFLSGDI